MPPSHSQVPSLTASEIYNKSCNEQGKCIHQFSCRHCVHTDSSGNLVLLRLKFFQGVPPKVWAEEVAVYVHDHIRNYDEIAIYFPNLPARPLNSLDVASLNANKCEREALEAKRKYESISKCKFED